MALARSGMFEVRSGGNDLNAGYCNPAGTNFGTDYSLQDAPQVTIDGTTVTATVHTTTTQVTLTGFAVSAALIRNGLRVTGGTATAGLYEITAADTANNRLTLDRAVGTTGQTVQGRVGGALASPGFASGQVIGAGQVVFVKYSATPYLVTSATGNVSGGTASPSSGSSIVGYDTSRTVSNTDANRPTLKLGVDTAALFSGSRNFQIRGFTLDGDNRTGSIGVVDTFGGVVSRCNAQNFTAGAFGGSGVYVRCRATGCATVAAFFGAGMRYYCEAYNNGGTGYQNGSAAACLSYNNGGSGYLNVRSADRCVAYANGGSGFRWTSDSIAAALTNCVAEANTGAGYDTSNTSLGMTVYLTSCADYNNVIRLAPGSTTQPIFDVAPITGTASLFVNASGGNFAPTAMLRGAGYPGTFPSGTTSTYHDVGAAQSQPTNPAYPAATDVRLGVDRGDGATGTLASADPNYVHTSHGYGAGGTEYTGQLTLPAAGNVDTDNGAYGVGGTGTTPTFARPPAGKVETGYPFGAGGTEYTGTLVSTGITQTELNATLTAFFGGAGVFSANVVKWAGADVPAPSAAGVPKVDTVRVGGDAFTLVPNPPTAAEIRIEVDANSTKLAAVYADTHTALPAALGTIVGYIDTEVGAIKQVTDTLAQRLPSSGTLSTAGSAVTLADGAITAATIADGAITDMKLTLPDEAGGVPTRPLQMLMWIAGCMGLRRFKKDAAAGTLTQYMANDTTVKTVSNFSSTINTDTVDKAQ